MCLFNRGSDPDRPPRMEDYAPSRKLRRSLKRAAREEERREGHQLHLLPLILLIIAIIALVSVVVFAYLAWQALRVEDMGSARALFLLFGPLITTWFIAYFVEMGIGLELSGLGTLFWGVSLWLTGSEACMWLFGTAGMTLLIIGVISARYL